MINELKLVSVPSRFSAIRSWNRRFLFPAKYFLMECEKRSTKLFWKRFLRSIEQKELNINFLSRVSNDSNGNTFYLCQEHEKKLDNNAGNLYEFTTKEVLGQWETVRVEFPGSVFVFSFGSIIKTWSLNLSRRQTLHAQSFSSFGANECEVGVEAPRERTHFMPLWRC